MASTGAWRRTDQHLPEATFIAQLNLYGANATTRVERLYGASDVCGEYQLKGFSVVWNVFWDCIKRCMVAKKFGPIW